MEGQKRLFHVVRWQMVSWKKGMIGCLMLLKMYNDKYTTYVFQYALR